MEDQERVPERREFKVMLPMRIKTSSKKLQALNLNVYRNLHHRSLHAQKKEFEKVAKKLLRGIPPLGVITLHYEVFVETRRRLDIMNVGSIVDKYFSDTLTAVGIIEDDDFKNIPSVSFSYGGRVDKEHILVTITEIEKRKEDTPMRVLLDREDIQKALTAYVAGLSIPNANGVVISAENGIITAEVLFGTTITDESPVEADLNTTEDVTPPRKRGRGGRPKGSKNLPKTEPKEDDDVGTPVQTGAADSSTGAADAPEAETSKPPASDGSEEVAGPTPTTTGTKKGNLFGDEGTPSSEDDDGGQAEATPVAAPEPPVTEDPPKKKGSIFDA